MRGHGRDSGVGTPFAELMQDTVEATGLERQLAAFEERPAAPELDGRSQQKLYPGETRSGKMMGRRKEMAAHFGHEHPCRER